MSDKKIGIDSFGVSFGDKREAPSSIQKERGSFRIVVLGEYAPKPDYSTAAPAVPTLRRVERHNFDEVVAAVGGSFSLDIPDPFERGGRTVRADVRLRELRDLRPDGLVEAASIPRALLEARKIVRSIQDGHLTIGSAAEGLRRVLPRAEWAERIVERMGMATPSVAPPAPTPSAGSGLLDALLDETQATDDKARANGLSNIVAAVAKSARSSVGKGTAADVSAALQLVDGALVEALKQVLHHPELRRLEQHFRALRFLVDRADPRAGVEIDLVVCSKATLVETLAGLAAGGAQVAMRGPIDLFVVDEEFEPTAVDLAVLEAAGLQAAEHRAPIVTNGSAAFLGFDQLDELRFSNRRHETAEDPRCVAVGGLASREAARWISICMNRFLLRAAYDASTSRLREPPFREDSGNDKLSVFGGSAMAVATLAAASWVRSGWAWALTGPRNGMVSNLPVREVPVDGVACAFSAEVLFSIDVQRAVGRAAIGLLTGAPNHDSLVASRLPMLFRGAEVAALGSAGPQLELADQLFVCRLSHLLEHLGAAIPRSTPAQAVEEVARITLADVFGARGPQVSAHYRDGVLEVTVRAKGFGDVTLEEVSLGVRLGA